MRKIVVHRAGGYEELQIESHPDLSPGPGEVRVEVAAIGINFADCVVRMGLYDSAKKYVGWPITPGFEVAGVIGALGDGVDEWAVGDEVFAVTRFGGYATQVVVSSGQVFHRPDSLSVEKAAGFPTVFLTADYALSELGRPRPGQRVLVHSAAGGVGGALVQLARHAGCTVVGVVGGAHKVKTAETHGAHEVIDTSRQRLWPAAERFAPENYHIILDANGVSTLRQSYQHLAEPGRLIVYGFHTMFTRGRGTPSWPKMAAGWLRTPRFDPLDMTGANRSVMAFNLSYLFTEHALLAESMGRLMTWLEAGDIQPSPVRTWSFDEVADAHQTLETGQTVGKMVLLVS